METAECLPDDAPTLIYDLDDYRDPEADVPIEVLAACDLYVVELLARIARTPEGQALLAALESEALRFDAARNAGRVRDLLGPAPKGFRLAHGVTRGDLASIAAAIVLLDAREVMAEDHGPSSAIDGLCGHV